MSLPPVPPATPPAQAKVDNAQPAAPSEQPDVLIVEDDNDGRRILSLALEYEALRVVQASSGDDAQDMLDRGLKPQVLIADMHLPGKVQGGRLAAALSRKLPAAGIILMSGGFDAGRDDEGPHNAVRIDKPAPLKTIVEAVRAMLPVAASSTP